MTDAEKLAAAIVAALITSKPPPIQSVTEEEGLAVFRGRSGQVLGSMNWNDYKALMAELANK